MKKNDDLELYEQFLQDLKLHDYSYMMSDDNRYYDRGIASEKSIKEQLNLLINTYGYDPTILLNVVLIEVPEGFICGLTHKVIRNWFKYIPILIP